MLEFFLGRSLFGFVVRGVVLFILIVMTIIVLAMTWPAHAADAAVGDSIALGTGRALRVPTQARQGAGSCEIARYVTVKTPWDRLAISAGINDGGRCVAALRARVRARKVTWILPAPINPARAVVATVAQRYGDSSVSYACAGGCSRRNFHPASYGVVAAAVRKTWR